jgi:MoxR-like ATPase
VTEHQPTPARQPPQPPEADRGQASGLGTVRDSPAIASNGPTGQQPAGTAAHQRAGLGAPQPGDPPGSGRRASDQPAPTGPPSPGAAEPAEAARAALNRVRAEVGKVVVGQDSAITGLVIALLCRGHVLLEGVPGVAKTLMVRALAAALRLDHKRLQFTPDLMPGDVTGSLVYDVRTAEFSFREGPVFTNLLLADEINRTPPKTQASLLEAMEERQVSVDGLPRPLPEPFVVIATQNPIEYEGTYPLPEAQLDRFLLKLAVPLPSRDDEFRVLNAHHRGFDPRDLRAAGVVPVAGATELAAGRLAVRSVQAAAEVLAYVVDLCRATRQSPSLSLGASPRGATALLATAKAWAWLSGRDYVTPDDVKALARPSLRHRVVVRPEAELEGVSADGVLDSVLAAVPAPR